MHNHSFLSLFSITNNYSAV